MRNIMATNKKNEIACDVILYVLWCGVHCVVTQKMNMVLTRISFYKVK